MGRPRKVVESAVQETKVPSNPYNIPRMCDMAVNWEPSQFVETVLTTIGSKLNDPTFINNDVLGNEDHHWWIIEIDGQATHADRLHIHHSLLNYGWPVVKQRNDDKRNKFIIELHRQPLF